MAKTRQHRDAEAAPNGRPEPVQGKLGATIRLTDEEFETISQTSGSLG